MIRNGTWVTEYPPGATIEVDRVGAGCLLVHRSVLESMPPQRPEAGKHWFDWRVDMRGVPGTIEYECSSEDFTFCDHYRKMGGKVLVDTSIVCRHVGLAQAGPGTFLPCEVWPIT